MIRTVAPYLVMMIGLILSLTPAFFDGLGAKETTVARAFGMMVFVLAILSAHRGMAFLRRINEGVCLALVLTPIFAFNFHPSAIVAQTVAGLLGLGLSMLDDREGLSGWGSVLRTKAANDLRADF